MQLNQCKGVLLSSDTDMFTTLTLLSEILYYIQRGDVSHQLPILVCYLHCIIT